MERHFMMTAIKNAASENKTFDVEDLTFVDNCIIKHGRFLGKVRVLPNMALMAVIGENGKAYDIPLYLLTDKSIERLYEQSEVYGEVRCDYLDEENGWWCIDTWETPDDNEEGEVVGWIDDQSGNIYYKHETAKCSQKVREVALAKQSEIRAERKQRNGELGETMVMLASDVWHRVYDKMREPDCTQLAAEIRDAAHEFESKWRERDSDEKEGYYLDEIDSFADKLTERLIDQYC